MGLLGRASTLYLYVAVKINRKQNRLVSSSWAGEQSEPSESKCGPEVFKPFNNGNGTIVERKKVVPRPMMVLNLFFSHFSYIVVAWKLCFASGDVASVHELQDSRVADGLYCMRICDPLWCRPVSTQPKLSDTRVCLSGGFGHCLYSCIARPGKKAEAISSALRWLLRRTSTSSSHSAAEGVYSINLE